MQTVYIATIDGKSYQIDGAVWLRSSDVVVYRCVNLRTLRCGYTAYSPKLKRFSSVGTNVNDVARKVMLAELNLIKKR